MKEVNICIATYNRLIYLNKCIDSIIMGAEGKIKIHVIDDMSTDGTREFLTEYKERGLIDTVIFNKKKLGTAENFNRLISTIDNEWVICSGDDMWFKSGWDTRVKEIISKYDDCGLLSIFNWRLFDKCSQIFNEELYFCLNTGLGSCVINRELYEKAGKFQCKGLMGFFARPFCFRCNAVQIKRNKHYALRKPVAIHIGERQCRINSEAKLVEYGKFRNLHKKGITS